VTRLIRSTWIFRVRLRLKETHDMDKRWIRRCRKWVAPTKVPGVRKIREGGYLVRARVTDPATGKMVPGFGEFFVDRIQTAHAEAWKPSVADLIRAGDYAPTTCNGAQLPGSE